MYVYVLLFSILYISSNCLKLDEENKSLSNILKLLNQNPGLEIRVDFDEVEEVKTVAPTSTTKKPKVQVDSNSAVLLLAKELNQTSSCILQKLDKTAVKLGHIIERLGKIEEMFREKPRSFRNKVGKSLNETDSEEDIANLLLTNV